MDLYHQFCQALTEHDLWQQGERLLVAVSGGPDSVALLHLCYRYAPRSVGVFHLDHGFRVQAQAEARFVQELANSWQLPCHLYSADVPTLCKQQGLGCQAGARQVRYRLLNECLQQHGYVKAATGHQADDQAETVLLRLLRGTGVAGLGGIPWRNGVYIRPLLQVSRQQINCYLQQFDLSYVTDSSNAQSAYRRNRVRNQLLPQLEQEYNPQLRRALCRLANLAQADEAQLERDLETWWQRLVHTQQGRLWFSRCKFAELSLSLQRRLLQRCFRQATAEEYNLGFVQVERLRQLIDKGLFSLPLAGVMVTGEYERIVFGSYPKGAPPALELPVPGEVEFGSHQIFATLTEQLPTMGRYAQVFDADKLQFPLVIRSRQKGDVFTPFGGGRRKLKQVLIDAKVPRDLRDQLPLVQDQEEILWAVGLRRGAKAPVTAVTTRFLLLQADVRD